MKKIVVIIVSAFATAVILIWSLTTMIGSSAERQHESPAVTHTAGSH
jgi:uncharacterized alpha/beta hydrolase family protein